MRYEIKVYESSRIILAQIIGDDVSEEDAQKIVKQFDGHKYITATIQKDEWLSKHRGKVTTSLNVCVRYPEIHIIHENGCVHKYELV